MGDGDLDPMFASSGEEQQDLHAFTSGAADSWDPLTFLDGLTSYMRLSNEDREELYAFTKVSSCTMKGEKYSRVLPV